VVASEPSLSQLRGMKPINFEHRVAEMYSKLGCKKEITDKAAGDGGIDIILRKMGKKYLVQCKRYSEKNTIKVGVVRELMGVVASENADGGWVVTTSTFTKAAKDFAKKNKILKLIDSSDLMDDMKKSLA
ncbi:MAG: restriction endonuclease, partial [Candidatus Latescibacteria bacterium]|nr:restriction endonuclease [Candidatus Latescibacterota bacterium]